MSFRGEKPFPSLTKCYSNRRVCCSEASKFSGRVMLPRDIISDYTELYVLEVLYSKVHARLEHALTLSYGDSAESYEHLHLFCYALKETNLRNSYGYYL